MLSLIVQIVYMTCVHMAIPNVKDIFTKLITSHLSNHALQHIVLEYIEWRMIAQVTGYELGEYIFNIGDCHVYTRHIDNLKIQMEREQFEAPELWINPEVKDFYR